jgi:site-specific DNA-methyltransferase (adenine-specific)
MNIKLEKGDCMEIMQQLIDKKINIDVVIADIPYDEVSSLGQERKRYSGQLRNIDKSNADIITFDIQKMNTTLHNINFDSAYIFCGINQIHYIYNYFKYNMKKHYMCRLITWHKTNPSPANGQHMPLSASEYIIFIKRRKTKYHGHCEHNVFTFPTCHSKLHPTEKPQKLLQHILKLSSNEGDTVLDFCFGSGSTGVACKNLNRNFIGIELDKDYYDIAKKRIEETK